MKKRECRKRVSIFWILNSGFRLLPAKVRSIVAPVALEGVEAWGGVGFVGRSRVLNTPEVDFIGLGA